MAPTPLSEGAARVSWLFGLSGDPEVMRTGCDFLVTAETEEGFIGALTQAGQDFEAAHALLTPAEIAVGWTYLGWEAVGMYDDLELAASGPEAIIGTKSAATPPNNCAILVHKRSNVAGRRGRGRMFLPPWFLTEETVDRRGMIDSALVTQTQNRMNTAFASWLANSPLTLPVLLHSLPVVDEGPPPVYGPQMAPTAITAFQVAPQLATQRRRMRP